MAGRDEQTDGPTSFHDEPCVICRGLKEFQSGRTFNPNQQALKSLCNLHTWLLAKTAEAGTVAEVLLQMLEYPLKEEWTGANCGVCASIAEEEERKLGEFARGLGKPESLLRLQERGGICIPHARKLLDRVTDSVRNEIISALQQRVVELRRELTTLSRSAKAGEAIHPGVLGRAAEFLVANRGLDTARRYTTPRP